MEGFTTVVFVVNIHHLVCHLPRSNPMNFKHLQKGAPGWTHVVTIKVFYLLSVWIICIESSELEFRVSEEYQEVRTVALFNLLHHSPSGLFVNLGTKK